MRRPKQRRLRVRRPKREGKVHILHVCWLHKYMQAGCHVELDRQRLLTKWDTHFGFL